MKRIISICLVMIFVLGFVACNGEGQDGLLSDDLNSLMFQLDGVIYTFPVHFSELEENGWEAYDPDGYFADEALGAAEFDVWELRNGEQNISKAFTNLTEGELAMSESYITGFAVLAGLHSAQVVLPGNITIGSTYEDVMDAYGDILRHIWEYENFTRFLFDAALLSLTVSIDIETNQVILLHINFHRN